jgi:hypothetical protein
MNEMIKKPETEITPWDARAAETDHGVFAGDLLKFKKGFWYRGEIGKPVENGTRVIVNMGQLWTGWIKWQDKKPVEYRGGVLTTPVDRKELGDEDKSKWERDARGDAKDPWVLTDMLVVRDIETGDLMTFSTSSAGGRSLVGKLCTVMKDNYMLRPGQFPVCELGASSYEHRDHGTVFKPALNVVGWQPWDPDAIEVTPDDPRTLVAKDLDDEIPF